MRRAYCEFHRLGRAHSIEAWEADRLVGGLYGVNVDGAFVGESMFYRKPNASKLAMLHLVDHLRDRGLDWIDVQVMSPHLAALGAKVIERDRFLLRLAETRRRGLKLF
jgi:leucyl/phenylalanyl-tRNA--protein transferase